MLHARLGPDRVFPPSELEAHEVFQEQPAFIVKWPIQRTRSSGTR